MNLYAKAALTNKNSTMSLLGMTTRLTNLGFMTLPTRSYHP
jgi:hypothetical protein